MDSFARQLFRSRGQRLRRNVCWTVERTVKARRALTFLAFGGAVLIAGANLVAVRFTSTEVPPFFGAGFRFGVAGAVLIAAAAIVQVPKPTKHELTGTLFYGLLAFGGAMALGYWSFQELPASIGGLIIATVPVMTLLLARLQGLEPFRMRGLLGGILTVGGIWYLVAETGGGNVPVASVLTMFGAAFCMAEAGIIVKKYKPCHPLAFNGLAMTVGAIVLLGGSLLTDETWTLPTSGDVWLAMAFMVLAGSVALFALYLFVLKGWSASTASYQYVLIPLVTALLASWILDETLSSRFAVGAALVLAGVYLGALSTREVALPGSDEQEAYAQRCSTT